MCATSLSIANQISKIANQKSKIANLLNSVHRVEEVFALCVDADAQALALRAEAVFERGHGLPRARDVGDDDHRELGLYDRLVDVNDAAPGLGQNLRDGGDDARLIHAEH